MRMKKQELASGAVGEFHAKDLQLCMLPIRGPSYSDNKPLWELTLSFYVCFMLNHVQWSLRPGPFLSCRDKTLITFWRMLCLLILPSRPPSFIVILCRVRPRSAELNLTSWSFLTGYYCRRKPAEAPVWGNHTTRVIALCKTLTECLCPGPREGINAILIKGNKAQLGLVGRGNLDMIPDTLDGDSIIS